MIQRIQTVYLFLSAVVVLAVPVVPGLATHDGWAWYTPVTVAASILIAVGCLVAIFMYKDRKRQRGLVTIAWLVALGLALILVGGAVVAPAGGPVPALPSLVPVVLLVLLFLARRAITKDIELVRSMDRLR